MVIMPPLTVTVLTSLETGLLAALNEADITKTGKLPALATPAPVVDQSVEAAKQLTETISAIEIEKITPLDALVALGRLKEMI